MSAHYWNPCSSIKISVRNGQHQVGDFREGSHKGHEVDEDDGSSEGHEGEEEEDAKDKDSGNKKYNFDKKGDDEKEKENTLQEAVRRIARAKKVFLNGKRIK